MVFAIFTSAGNLVESFGELQPAKRALQQIVADDPEALDHVAIISIGDDGVPLGEPILPQDPQRSPGLVDVAGPTIQGVHTASHRSRVQDETYYCLWTEGPAQIIESAANDVPARPADFTYATAA